MILVWNVNYKLKPLNFGTLMISVYWSQAKMDLWKQIFLECNSAAVPESLRKIYAAAGNRRFCPFLPVNSSRLLSDLHFSNLKLVDHTNFDGGNGDPPICISFKIKEGTPLFHSTWI